MGILSMLIRSILSYTVFLASRKIVRGGVGIGESLRKNLKLHRCENCWRLYSGEIEECTFCGEHTKPLYRIFQDDIYGPYNDSQEQQKREGIERHLYNETRGVKFNPLTPPKLEVRNDRRPRRTSPQPSRSNQRRDPSSTRYSNDNRGRGYSNSGRNTELGEKPGSMAQSSYCPFGSSS